jgi:hypothetical protein
LLVKTATLTSRRALTELIEQCASLWCSSIAASVHARLPREVRDAIYDHLWDQKSREDLDKKISAPYIGACDSRVHKEWVLKAPFFSDARFMGHTLAHEAAARFFRTLKARVAFQVLPVFLRIERFGSMELRPIDFMRCLTVDVGWANLKLKALACRDLRHSLVSLLQLPIKEDFAIVLSLGPNVHLSQDLFVALEIIRPTYQALVAKGVKIKVLGFHFFPPGWREDRDILATKSTNKCEWSE